MILNPKKVPQVCRLSQNRYSPPYHHEYIPLIEKPEQRNRSCEDAFMIASRLESIHFWPGVAVDAKATNIKKTENKKEE